MTSVGQLKSEHAALIHWMRAAFEAASLFEARWTLAALKRVDADIYRRLCEQRALFDKALITGSVADIDRHGAAMCRGYALAVMALERAGEADNAYLLGQDPGSGLRVAIGDQKAAAARVQEVHGKTVVWVTPDEVAIMLANIEAFKPTASIKLLFPGAEIVELRSGSSANGDGDGA
jgi:hypothetical protein